ncbi:hypothetical protein CBS101457_004619 [Exobasidium rhododendri]|nr:hypothetical protein CBS101457_004619 [Exobasidium rhododendri]
MSTVSPVSGTGAGAANNSGPNPAYSQQHSTHHSAGSTAASHHHHSNHGHPASHHSSSHDGNAASGLPNSSFDSVTSHHTHQHSSQPSASPASSSPWGHQGNVHYGSSASSQYGSHGMYSPSGYYSSSHGNFQSGGGGGGGNPNMGSGYSAYSVQPHQGQQQQQLPPSSSMYASHSSNGMNGSANVGSTHHSGSSTPTSGTPYNHHSQSMNSVLSSQGYPQQQHHQQHHQQSNGYYGAHSGAPSNGMMSSSPSYTSAPQYSTQLPLAGRHRVTTTLWEDEGTLCFQVDARGVCVARRHDNNMINGTKLLNVCGMSRGKRDGILKNEKERVVVKVGAMHLKGVWITFQRGRQLAEQNDILDVLYPLFETNIQSFLYHPDNYPRTAAVMAAAQERHAHRSRVSEGTSSPTGYSAPQRASSHSSGNPILNPQQNPPPLMRANTTPTGALMAGSNSGNGNGPLGHHYANAYSSTTSHPSAHLSSQQHSPYTQAHSVSNSRVARSSDASSGNHTSLRSIQENGGGDRGMMPLSNSIQLNSPYAVAAPGMQVKQQRNGSPLKEEIEEQGQESGLGYQSWAYRGDPFNKA